MALIQISELPVASTTESSDLFITDQGGVTKNTTKDKILLSTKTAYEAADTVLQNHINTEIANRSSGDSVNAAAITVEQAARIAGDALSVLKAGGTMTGALTLIAPTADLHAATKKYVDDNDAKVARALESFSAVAGTFPTTWGGNAIKLGARFVISVAGTITSSDAVAYILRVGDVLEAFADTPLQLSTNWRVFPALVEPATETKKGISEIASSAETIAMSNNTNPITPFHLGEIFDSILTRSETVSSTPFNLSTTGFGTFLVDTSVARTINLVSIATIAAGYSGHIFVRIVDKTGSANINNITINSAAGDTVAGLSSIKIIAPYDCITLIPVGTNWHVVGDSRYKYNSNICSAYMIAATQAIADNSTTKILFDTLENSSLNALGQFKIATSVFNPTFAGLYSITIQAKMTHAALQDVVLSVTQGGTVKGKTQFTTGIADYGNYFTYNSVVSLAATTDVEFNILQNTAAGGAVNLLGTTIHDTFLRIKL